MKWHLVEYGCDSPETQAWMTEEVREKCAKAEEPEQKGDTNE